MTEPYAPPPGPPGDDPAAPEERRSRAGVLLLFGFAFGAGFLLVVAMLVLRAPDGGGGGRVVIQPPDGYVLLDDARSGGGRLTEGRAATVLGRPNVPGFRDGLLRAWGKRPGEPPRSVVVLGIEVGNFSQAESLRRGYVEAALRRGATTFGTPGVEGTGLHDVPDAAGRHAQRVVFAVGPRLFVVSVVTPERDPDTAEVVALAKRQSAAG